MAQYQDPMDRALIEKRRDFNIKPLIIIYRSCAFGVGSEIFFH